MSGPQFAGMLARGQSLLFREDQPRAGESGTWAMTQAEASPRDWNAMLLPAPLNEYLPRLEDRDGGVWYRPEPLRQAQAAFYLKGQKVTRFPEAATPILVGSRDWVWFVAGPYQLRLKAGDLWGGVQMGELSGQVLESPDKRIWALLDDSFSQVQAEKQGNELRVSELHRWPGGMPLGQRITLACCDADNALWIAWPGQLRRIVLPPAK